ncbi:MAG TPA: hypothetical protein PLA97_19385 [Rubrivivax sp.]|nr:hypothetical protein [Rubrivivax sp.]
MSRDRVPLEAACCVIVAALAAEDMYTAFILLLILAILVGLWLLLRRGSSVRKSTLRALANELGLAVTERRPLGRQGMRREGDRAAQGLDEATASVWGTMPEARGTWNGRQVSMGVLPARRYRVPVAARLAVPEEWGLFVAPRGAGIAMRPERLTTVPSPDAAFDEAIEVAARDVEKVKPLLDRPGVRSALRAALAMDETSCVLGCWIYVQPYDTAIADATAARLWLGKVSGAAEALDLALGR